MKIALAAALIAAGLAPSAFAQQGPVPSPRQGPGGPGPMGVAPASKAEIVAAMRKAIAENYVVAAKRAPLDAALVKGLKSGRYEVADQGELTRRVNEDLYAVAADKHLQLIFDPPASAELAQRGPQADDVEDSPFLKAMMRAHNHGVAEMRVLPGNIRLVTLRRVRLDRARERGKVLDAAMAFLRGGDAAILDLRRNGGGSPEAVRHIVSYFTAPGTPLVDLSCRHRAGDDVQERGARAGRAARRCRSMC
jgi:hypothetical protein